jgi:hypothetical protein
VEWVGALAGSASCLAHARQLFNPVLMKEKKCSLHLHSAVDLAAEMGGPDLSFPYKHSGKVSMSDVGPACQGWKTWATVQHKATSYEKLKTEQDCGDRHGLLRGDTKV